MEQNMTAHNLGKGCRLAALTCLMCQKRIFTSKNLTERGLPKSKMMFLYLQITHVDQTMWTRDCSATNEDIQKMKRVENKVSF